MAQSDPSDAESHHTENSDDMKRGEITEEESDRQRLLREEEAERQRLLKRAQAYCYSTLHAEENTDSNGHINAV